MSHLAKTSLVLLILACATPTASAGERPSFYLRFCSWYATHIVVVTEGERIDGDLEVLESWKGDLKKGDKIKVPELVAFAQPAKRIISPAMGPEPLVGPPDLVSGSRMVLFLKRADGIPTAKPEERKWVSSDIFRSMMASIAWIERGNVYAFVQEENPGPSRLILLPSFQKSGHDPLSEEEMKTEATSIIQLNEGIVRARSLPTYAERVEALVPFTRCNHYEGRRAAVEGLGQCGESALPILKKMLKDDEMSNFHAHLVQALTLAAGKNAGAELTALVEQELAFWKQTAGQIKKGWWGDTRLSSRYSKTIEVFYCLSRTPYSASKQPVTDFRDFWRSQPHLEEIGNGQMSQACDRVLEKLGE